MARLRIRHRSGASSIPGRLFMSIFGLVFIGLGSTFVYFIARGFLGSVATYSWTPAECVISTSRVETIPGETETYRLLVEYRYVAFGREHTGEVLRPGYDGSSDVAETDRLAARYAAGPSVGCYVDPGNPASATLERPGLLSGLWVLFPLVFVGVGILVLVIAWSPSRLAAWQSGAGTTAAAGTSRALSKRAGPSFGPGCLVLFFAVFALAGAGTSLFFLIPASKVLKARSWPALPCTIESSGVTSHPGDDSTTYSVDVRYRYEIEGKTYRGSRYQFLGGSSSGHDGKQRIVDRLPPGSEATCFVNPQDPFDAVIERDFTPGYLVALVPLLFLCVGLGGMIFALRVGSGKPRPAWQPAAAGSAPAASLPMTGPSAGFRFAGDGPVTLEGKSSPVGRFLGTLFVAAFWNGITGVFLWQVIGGWRTGAGDGCLTLFLLPFVLIGLLLLVAVPHAFLALFNPRAVLTLSRAALPLGGSAELAWRFKGWPSRISRLRITLEGKESATYGSGKQSSTSHSVFSRQVLADTTDSLSIASGRVTLSLPEDTMHSFETNHHKVLWTLKVAGTLRYWPDVAEEIALTVTPPGAST